MQWVFIYLKFKKLSITNRIVRNFFLSNGSILSLFFKIEVFISIILNHRTPKKPVFN